MYFLLSTVNLTNRVFLSNLNRLSSVSIKTKHRTFKLTTNSNNLSNPFKPKNSKSNKDIDEFLNEKLKNVDVSQQASKSAAQNDNLLARIAKFIVNPIPMNVSIRDRFKLDDSFKLVYIIDNERSHLVIYSLINVLFPVMFAFLGLFIYAEATGASQMSKSFDHPYMFVSFMTFYITLVYSMARKTQSQTIMRIYYNEKKNEFVSFRQTGFLINYKKDVFNSNDVLYRLEPGQLKKENKLVYLLTRQMGNIYIKNQMRLVNFKQFSSDSVIEKMLGKRNFDLIKQKTHSK